MITFPSMSFFDRGQDLDPRGLKDFPGGHIPRKAPDGPGVKRSGLESLLPILLCELLLEVS